MDRIVKSSQIDIVEFSKTPDGEHDDINSFFFFYCSDSTHLNLHSRILECH